MTTYEDVFGAPKADQPEAGAYRARLSSIIIKDAKDGSKFRVWTFTVDGAEIVVSGTSSTAMGPESKAFQWATALLGREPKAGEGIDKLINQPCTVVTAIDQKGYAKVVSVAAWPEGRSDAQTVADEPLSF